MPIEIPVPGSGPTLSELAALGPLYFDHRGWPDVFPEETLDAYRASVAGGAQFVEVDVQALRDGTLVCMHDLTVDRTTTAAGNVADFSGPGWSQLVVDAGSFLGGGWGNLKAPLFEDIVREFGNRQILLIEVKDEKDSTAAAILALLQRYQISKEHVLINSSTQSNLTAFIADGWDCSPNYTVYAGTPTPGDIVATGATWVGVGTGTDTAQMDALRTAGLKVAVFTIYTLKQVTEFQSHSDALYTDEGAYVRGTARGIKDPFSNQTWYHGQLKGNTSGGGGGRGVFYPPNLWGFEMGAGNGFASALQGWANPIGGSEVCNAMQIQFTVKFDLAFNTSRWASLAVTTKDTAYNSDGSGSGLNGYHFLAVKNGGLSIYRLDNGTATALELKTTGITSIPDGGSATYKVTITATSVKLERLDIAYSTTELMDATYRGAMLHAGVKGTNSKFSSITVTV